MYLENYTLNETNNQLFMLSRKTKQEERLVRHLNKKF
jgi:hypothetical protein